MSNKAVIVKRILVLASVLVLMLALCGCRTRITNNDEVSGVVYDEDGYLKDDYDMRRDELSLAKAKKPIFTGFGREDEEEEYYYGDDAEALEEYEPEEFQEEPEDEEQPEPAQNTTVNNRQQSTARVVNRRRSKNHNKANPPKKSETKKEEPEDEEPTPVDPVDPGTDEPTPVDPVDPGTDEPTPVDPVDPGTVDPTPVDPDPQEPTQEETVAVILDANGGTCGSDRIEIKKGGNYGELPVAEKEGFDFTGWFTEATGGTQITSETKLISDEEHTIYAQYQESAEPEPEVKTFTVTFDLNDGDTDVKASFSPSGDPIQVEENGTYPALPAAVREGYLFEGWFTEPTDGERVGEGDTFTAGADQTLYVHWKQEDPYDTWTKKYDEAAGTVKDGDKKDFFVDGHDKSQESFIKDCKGNTLDEPTSDKTIYVVQFIKNIDEEKASAADSAIRSDERYAEKTVATLLVDEDAVKGDNNTKLAYKMVVLNILYGKPDEATLSDGLTALGVDIDFSKKIYLYN